MVKETAFYIESLKGHDAKNVPAEKVREEVESHLKDDKWVTLEKEDGSTDILTQGDMPQATEEDEGWAEKFEHVTSAVVTNKAKGG